MNIGGKNVPRVIIDLSQKMIDYKVLSDIGYTYLKDVDNQRKGGELILHDPSFHNNFGFTEQNQFPISTIKNRLVIAPAYIWHEVTPYTGEENRVSIVLNLDIFSESDLLESVG